MQDSFEIERRIADLSTAGKNFDHSDVKSLIDDLRKFYPPVPPLVSFRKGDVIAPITASSPLTLRYIVEFMSDSFRQEASIMYGHTVPLQFSAFKRNREFEAWLAYLDSVRMDISEDEIAEISKNEGIDSIKAVVGCLLFYKDPSLSEDQKKISEWVAAFAWIHPYHRGEGALKSIIGPSSRYGDYWLEGPLSPTMQKICARWQIAETRVLSSDRHSATP